MTNNESRSADKSLLYKLTSPPRPLSHAKRGRLPDWRKTAAPRSRWYVYYSHPVVHRLVCTCQVCWCTSADVPSLHHTLERPCSPGAWLPGSSSSSGSSPTATGKRIKLERKVLGSMQSLTLQRAQKTEVILECAAYSTLPFLPSLTFQKIQLKRL